MDNQKLSAEDMPTTSDWQEFEQYLLGKRQFGSGDIYPDQHWEIGMDSLVEENLLLDFDPEISIDEELSENMSNISGIEARFQSLLKHRLLQEMESRPLRFPWENGSEVYWADEPFGQDVARQPLLQPQLAAWHLPFNLPETMLVNLMAACSQAMQSLEPQGVKLVQAIQDLFEVEKLMLHQLAQWVMAAPAPSRSGQGAVLTGDFATANEQQRIAMSMIVAKTIMDRLMISLSPQQPQGELAWETTVGTISVQASLRDDDQGLAVAIALPCGGEATWESPQGSASATRMYPGQLQLTLAAGQGIYPVKITLHQAQEVSLTVAIAVKVE